MSEFDGEALTAKKGSLVQQARDAIHLNQILDVSLSSKSLQTQLELTILVRAVANPGYSIATLAKTAAQVDDG